MNPGTSFHLKHLAGPVRRRVRSQTGGGLFRRITYAIEKTGHSARWLNGRSSSIDHPGATFSGRNPSDFHQERKDGKACGNDAAAEIGKGCLRRHLLHDSRRCLEKPPRGTAPAFPHFHRPGGDQQQKRELATGKRLRSPTWLTDVNISSTITNTSVASLRRIHITPESSIHIAGIRRSAPGSALVRP